MGATRNTGYLENIILYDSSDNVGIAGAVNASYKVTLGGSLSGTAAVFSSSVTSTAFVPTGSAIPTNGMYLSAANTLNFATNSLNRLSISTSTITSTLPISGTSATFSGNVGINVTLSSWDSGFRALQIMGGFAAMGNANAGYIFGNGYNDGIDNKYFSTAPAARIDIGNGIVFRVAPSGTANTAIPYTAALTLASTGAATFSSSVTATSGTFNSGSTAQNFIIQSTNTGASATTLQISNSSNSAFNDGVKMIQGAGVFKIQDLVGANLLALDLTNTRVGIGTTSPNSLLHLFGSSATLTIDDSGNGTSKISFRPQGTSYSERGFLSINYQTGELSLGAGIANNTYFQTFYLNGSPRMTITSGGDVGIGNTGFSSTRLTVTGKSTTSSDFSFVANNSANTNLFLVRNDGMHIFQQGGGTESMRINSGGNVSIGNTSNSYRLDVSLDSGVNGQIIRINRSAGAYGWGIGIDAANSNLNFYNNGGTSVANINNSTGAYTPPSDQRMKYDILDSDSALCLIDEIRVRKFKWKSTGTQEDYGLIAQELVDILPTCVLRGDEENSWGISRENIVPFLIKAIQELKAELDILKNK